MVGRYLQEEKVPFNSQESESIVDDIIDELLGYGPLEPFLRDPSVSDILCNTYRDIYIERRGVLEHTDSRFLDNDHMRTIIDRIISRVGRRIDESSPMVDARLPDGSRVNAIIPPLAVDGPMLSIRRFSVQPLKMEDLIAYGTLPGDLGQLLAACVGARLNIMVSGGTGSGKTTLLNVLSGFIPGRERIITIEDSAELQLQQQHVVRLETRPASIEGTGTVSQRDLVRNSLRMRPDRIIIGEVRGEEAFDMLQAMNTGHEGSMSTIHANTARDALSRLEQMIGMAGMPMTQVSIRAQIASAVRMIVQTQRLSDGTRRVTSISEITGMEGEVIQMQEIYRFVRTGVSDTGTVIGEYRATGVRPRFLDELEVGGVTFSRDAFEPTRAL
jgi:pilus assembly protein CpaF